jgi:hypothetical protein
MVNPEDMVRYVFLTQEQYDSIDHKKENKETDNKEKDNKKEDNN